ncbi:MULTISPECIES: tubulin-like doman-containing protein [Corynebacterium]|uniref:tubulin-like doman-containing protein n=1 Tax=Corynebacterium TaxID=1716 RepID=UPI00124D4BE4|nr:MULTISPECIES: tubulin-like doman-containing protein [Corynebacterium]
MRKFLVVGCGGSGAKTLAYMMDQLKALIREVEPGRDSLPKAWQFVSIDAPLAAEDGPSGLANVEQAGGRYIGIGSHQSYRTFDAAVSAELARGDGLKDIATWAPRVPNAIELPISAGAAQRRTLGRMLTLPKLEKIREELRKALEDMNTSDANVELNELNRKIQGFSSDKSESDPTILVVSSMAGGSGASMFLDVCRVLAGLPNAKPEQTAVFLLTPEVFDSLPKDAMSGAWPNALAMFGEVFAAQTGAAAAADASLYHALGIATADQGSTFARLFPIGSRMGEERARFGREGSPSEIYRGLGRALSGLVYSEQASADFVQYDLGNAGAPDAKRSYLGWADNEKLKWTGLPWGSMGYAQLSMGRDKYKEYAAQRIARASFDQLLRGHIDPRNHSTGEEQLRERLAERLPDSMNRMKIHPELVTSAATTDIIRNWYEVLFHAELEAAVSESQAVLRSKIPAPVEGQKGQEWADEVDSVMGSSYLSTELRRVMQRSAYSAVYRWADFITDSMLAEAEEELSRLGIPYVEKMLSELDVIVKDKLQPGTEKFILNHQGLDPAARPADADQALHPVTGKKRIHNADAVVEQLLSCYSPQLRTAMVVELARSLSPVLEDFRFGVLRRLRDELDRAHKDVRAADKAKESTLDLADVATDEPAAWPRPHDEKVSDRFRGSVNEIVITEVDNFPADFEAQLLEAVSGEDANVTDLAEATSRVTRTIIKGEWETTDAVKAPRDTLARPADEVPGGNRAGWASKHLRRHPENTGESRESSNAVFKARIRPKDLLERARMWVVRPGESFERFISADLRSYMTQDEMLSDAEYEQRIARLRSEFSKALSLSRPLAAVDATMVQAVHGQGVTYRYSFSEIPFKDQRVAAELESTLSSSKIEGQSRTKFDNALRDSTNIQRIDIFGSYPNYSPIVFSSLLPQIAKEFKASHNRFDFWNLRRTHTLDAALPLSIDERKALVGGWLLGVATGRILITNQGTTDAAAHVYGRLPAHRGSADRAEGWYHFPSPMLTGPGEMRNEVDWMPAVLESILLAYANSHERDRSGAPGASLHPYWALRALFDDSPEKASNVDGGLRHPAVNTLARFLRTGEWPAERNGTRGTSIAERVGMVEEHLARALRTAEMLAPVDNTGFPSASTVDKSWAHPTSRERASKMPYYRDFAADVVEMANLLHGLLDEAQRVAEQPESTSSIPTGFSSAQTDNDDEFSGFGGGLL